MKALLQKDRPWIAGMLVAGTIALTAALGERSGFAVFVAGGARLEGPFHVAWIAGFVLGVVAACFDELLGTREFLRQRPLSLARLFGSRLCGCGVVLLGWLVLAPLGAWLLFVTFGEGWLFTRPVAVLQAAAGMVPAVSACAIGFAAGSLPTSWWRRLIAAALWFLAAFALVSEPGLLRGDSPHLRLVGLHLLVAAVFVGVAAVAMRHAADADRPWPTGLRVVALGPVVVAAALLVAAFLREPQVATLRRLYQAYPEIVGRGDELVLVHQVPGYAQRLVVDHDHRPTGEELPSVGGGGSWLSPGVQARQFGIDAPRWPWFLREAGGYRTGTVVLAADGAAWRRLFARGVEATGKGPELRPFGAGSAVAEIGDHIVVHDAVANDLWLLDAERGWFLPLPFPDDDVLEGLDTAWLSSDDDAALRRLVLPEDDGRVHLVAFVRAKRQGYVLRDGALVGVPGLREQGRSRAEDATPGAPDDAITWERIVPAQEQRPGFRHQFAPRTMMERLWAGAALSWSLLRPPALQVVGHLRAAERHPPCWFDPLVQGGRRTWLVLAGFAVAALGAWRVHRRLCAFAAPRATSAFWVVTTLLLGPIAAVLCLVFERPRAYARRALPGPFPAPRIVTETSIEETVA